MIQREAYQEIQDLVPDGLDHVKGLAGANRINEYIPVDANEVFGVQHAIFILRVGCQWLGKARFAKWLTWPAVSTISVAKSCPLYLMIRLKVFSIVG